MPLKIAVCVKQIPDPNQPSSMDGNRLKREGIPAVLDPGDEYGVEAGLQLAEANEGEVTIVSMGPASAVEAVRRALSMGAHKAILVTDDSLQGADVGVTARVLAAAIKRVEPNLVITGVESTDGSSGILPGLLAEHLGFPQTTFAKHLEVKDGTVVMQRQTEKGYNVVECPLPALVTVTAAVNEPRYPSFKGIMAAKQKPLEQPSLGDLGLSPDDAKPTQEIAGIKPAPERGAGEVIEDDGTAATKVVEFLKKEKVI